MLIDVHAHFYTELSGRSDWREINARRLDAGERIGITVHIGSILGTWGERSPTYFPSPQDVHHANERMLQIQQSAAGRVLGYCVVNPNYPEHAAGQIDHWVGEGLVGVKLAASRRADDVLLDPIAELAAERSVPILQHVWQHRRRDWPGQEASDAVELAALARRHPDTKFILAHLGGGGDWTHSLRAVVEPRNIWIDLSGSGSDVGMIESAVGAVGSERLVWGSDLTMDTAWGKLRYFESLIESIHDRQLVRHRNAREIFPTGVLDEGD
jgi:predicted TIM-barrel fold metal-dependent hydrolase